MVDAKITPIEWLRKQLQGGSDAPRPMVERFAADFMSAEAGAICSAGRPGRSIDLVDAHDGYLRALDSRVGTIEFDIPSPRHGTKLPGRV